MPDVFANSSSEDPVSAARRGGRAAMGRRFYTKVAAAIAADGYRVLLDDRAVRTPARRLLAAPTLPLAQAIAAEWDAQRDVIEPAKMPLTRLANAIIDGVAVSPGAVVAEIAKYLSSDLLFYRATTPHELCEQQARHWDPILAWAQESLGAEFTLGQGVIHVTQPNSALAAARDAIPGDPWPLGAAHAATTLTGSALLALALAHGRVTAEAAWQAAHVDDDWNMEQWGRDPLALERRAFHFAEFQAAATVFNLHAD
jgi:chaperone required for assembly of F1-ATPase